MSDTGSKWLKRSEMGRLWVDWGDVMEVLRVNMSSKGRSERELMGKLSREDTGDTGEKMLVYVSGETSVDGMRRSS